MSDCLFLSGTLNVLTSAFESKAKAIRKSAGILHRLKYFHKVVLTNLGVVFVLY